jgi:hypothetical protein
MQQDENELAPWQLFAGLVLFAVLTFFALGYFGYSFITMLETLLTTADAVTLNKGAFYCLGAAMMGFMLLYFGVRKLQGKPVSTLQNKRASQFFYISLGVTILLPQLLHFPTQSYLLAKGYAECALQSRQWMHDKVMVFTATPEHCIEMTIAQCSEDPDKQKCRSLPQYFNGKAVSY